MGDWVRLEAAVNYDRLDMAIRSAAADYGLEIGKYVDNHTTEWKLGSLKEDEKYDSTDITIRRRFLGRLRRPVFTLRVWKEGETEKFIFNARRHFPHLYSGTDSEARTFLERVGDYLKPRDSLMTALHAGRPRLE